jgi:two-component sensor histidine kinase
MLASQNRVQSMGILHQKLYQSEHLAFIEMKNYFMNLSENILDSYNANERVTVELPMSEIELDVDTAVPIGLIVNELLTNALKYAFVKNGLGTIRLSLIEKEKDHFELQIADNGIGKNLDSNVSQGTGFGTQLVALLTKQLGTLKK